MSKMKVEMKGYRARVRLYGIAIKIVPKIAIKIVPKISVISAYIATVHAVLFLQSNVKLTRKI